MDIDVDKIEAAEKTLDEFINARSRQKKEANAEEEAWKESTRRVNEKRRQANRQAWIDHHGLMNVLHTGLALEHASKRARLMAEGGYEPDETPDPEAEELLDAIATEGGGG